jgi:hypothetical protein
VAASTEPDHRADLAWEFASDEFVFADLAHIFIGCVKTRVRLEQSRRAVPLV